MYNMLSEDATRMTGGSFRPVAMTQPLDNNVKMDVVYIDFK